jgi:hypothetical protein
MKHAAYTWYLIQENKLNSGLVSEQEYQKGIGEPKILLLFKN